MSKFGRCGRGVRNSSERWGRTHARGKKEEVSDFRKLQAILNDLIHELQIRVASRPTHKSELDASVSGFASVRVWCVGSGSGSGPGSDSRHANDPVPALGL